MVDRHSEHFASKRAGHRAGSFFGHCTEILMSFVAALSSFGRAFHAGALGIRLEKDSARAVVIFQGEAAFGGGGEGFAEPLKERALREFVKELSQRQAFRQFSFHARILV